MIRVKEIDSDARGKVRCNNCKAVHFIGDLLVSGDSLVCPNCGEWEDFTEKT
jgi:RNA polymerase subunit RPABC4/transcription elongation factor Spt4